MSDPDNIHAAPADTLAEKVDRVFSSVASRYDVMNDLMSLGTHRVWKATLIDSLMADGGRGHLLDVAGGTGDIAEGYLAAGGVKATLVDRNAAMVKQGITRAWNRGIDPTHGGCLARLVGDAIDLPLGDEQVDTYVIAFGLRNIEDRPRALQEAWRVLKPGGRFFCLEFSKVTLPGVDQAYQLYSRLIPQLGQWVVGDKDSYDYLIASIQAFPAQPVLKRMVEAAGFKRCSWRDLSGGIAAIHSGWK